MYKKNAGETIIDDQHRVFPSLHAWQEILKHKVLSFEIMYFFFNQVRSKVHEYNKHFSGKIINIVHVLMNANECTEL